MKNCHDKNGKWSWTERLKIRLKKSLVVDRTVRLLDRIKVILK